MRLEKQQLVDRVYESIRYTPSIPVWLCTAIRFACAHSCDWARI